MNKKQITTDGQINTLKSQLARALADYDNLNKRVEKEREILRTVSGIGLIKKMLPLLDMLYDAQKHLNDPGLAIIISEFASILKEEGVEKISAQTGVKFDATVHEAVEAVDGDEGIITEEVLSGWKYTDGPVVRPAKVKVGKGKEVGSSLTDTVVRKDEKTVEK